MAAIFQKIFGGNSEKAARSTRALSYLASLAQSSEIAAVLDKGHYSGILIQLDVSSTELNQYFVDQNALSAFVTAVEQRITNREIEDPRIDPRSLGLESKPPSPTLDEVKRVVVSVDRKPVFNWSK